MLAKALYWGLVGDIPPPFAQSKIADVRTFLAIDSFDINKLADTPALSSLTRAIQAAADLRVADAERRLQQLWEKDAANATSVGKLRPLLQVNGFRAKAERDRAEAWKRRSLVLGFIAVILLLF